MTINSLKISKFRFTLEAIDFISLPAYKGSTFHGGFGHALKTISSTWYRYFFEPQSDKGYKLPLPFVLLPPLDNKETYAPYDQFHLELTLIGEATGHYAIAQAAIEYLGTVLGLGYKKGKFKIVSIDAASPSPDVVSNNGVINAADIVRARSDQLSHTRLGLSFPTRLRLKKDNRLYKSLNPPFQLIMERLSGRIKTLMTAYGDNASMTVSPSLQTTTPTFGDPAIVTIDHCEMKWDEWSRFSGRQKEWMKFGGLMGEVTYAGELKPFLPELILGEWLHIGNKTSFGLGKYILYNV